MRVDLRALSARHPAARAGSVPVLQSLDLRIAAGEQVAVIGPSGAGKTSLLQVLALALPPSAGSVQVDGVDPWQLPRGALQRLRGRLFLAPQVPPLPPRQRVVTAVLAGRLPALGLVASLRALVHPDDLPAAHAALAAFDLADKLFERVDRLSGGERQRVGLARALVAPARLWLIDEPLAALDPARSRQAVDALLRAAHERGATLVASLHQVDAALAHFPRIVGLQHGRVSFDLPAAEVTPALLDRLYATPDGPGTAPKSPPPAAARPVAVAMHCR